MKLKRLSLIIVILLISITCYNIMNTKYNPLARYPYANTDNRDVIIENMTQDDVNYLIQQKIKPEQFMDFIEIEGFLARNILYYEKCKDNSDVDLKYIVDFVNRYKEALDLETLPFLLNAYGYGQLEEFYNNAYPYKKEVSLIREPHLIGTKIKANEIVYKFVPKNLTVIDNSVIPFISKTRDEVIKVNEEVIEPLKAMLKDLSEVNGLTAGGLILTSGYISYEEQINIYENALIKYGFDEFNLYEDYPGQNESQLGYTLTFTIANEEGKEIKDSDQAKWLKEHALKYGFEIRYPEGLEDKTGKYFQPLTLLYIGIGNNS